MKLTRTQLSLEQEAFAKFLALPSPKRIHVSEDGGWCVMYGLDGIDYGPNTDLEYNYSGNGDSLYEAMIDLGLM